MLSVPRALCARSTYMALIRVWLGGEVPSVLEQPVQDVAAVGHVANI